MNVIVVGCGRVGAELALILGRGGHDVTVIDHVGSSFSHLDPAYRGRTIEAEPLGESVLEKAGVREAQALAAVTNSDAVNAVVAHVARTVYGVPNVVTRNYDPRWRVLHEAMGLTAVSSTAWGAQRIEELLERPRLRAVFSAGNGEVELYEVVVPEGWAGRTVAELVAGLACSPVSVARGGRASLPEPGRVLAAGDVVHVAAPIEGADILAHRLEGEA
jgi:trk system potassium uptake protein TrkA